MATLHFWAPWERIHLLEIAVFWRTKSLWPKISGKKGHLPQIILRVVKLDNSCYKNIARSCCRFVAMHAFDRRVQTDRRTDGQLLIEILRLRSCSALKIDWHYTQNCPQLWKLKIHIQDPTARLQSTDQMSHIVISSQYMNYSNDFGYYLLSDTFLVTNTILTK